MGQGAALGLQGPAPLPGRGRRCPRARRARSSSARSTPRACAARPTRRPPGPRSEGRRQGRGRHRRGGRDRRARWPTGSPTRAPRRGRRRPRRRGRRRGRRGDRRARRPASAPTSPTRRTSTRSSTRAERRASAPSTCSAPTPASPSAPDLGDDDADWDRAFDVNVMAHVSPPRACSSRLAGARRRALRLDRLGRGPADPDRLGALRGDQARRGRVRGVAVGHLRRPRRRRQLPVPDGRQHQHAQRGLDAEDADTALGATSWPTPATSSSPRTVADARARGHRDGAFLVLPHPEVLEFFRRKAADYDRWLRGMRRLQGTVTTA